MKIIDIKGALRKTFMSPEHKMNITFAVDTSYLFMYLL